MRDFLERLAMATRGCRDDMHEPEEQGVSAVFSGVHLDNAHGDNPMTNNLEYTVGIIFSDPVTGVKHMEWFNLATLIALARKAKL